MKILRGFLAAAVAVIIGTITLSVSAETGADTLDIDARSAILLCAQTGEILYKNNADEVLPPASITKIMSLLLVMEALERGDIEIDTVVTASAHAASMGGSQIWLREGESMTVDELLRATVIASANDATVALAEAVSGSEETFVAEMNERAARLHMNNTVFENATGLDSEGHHSTAHDVALMSAELIRHEKIKDYSTVWMDSLRDGKSELVNTNRLVRFYKGTTGLKTGTTSGAKYCLSATAERDGLSLVAVIMGGNSSSARFEGAKKLLDFGFSNYKFEQIKPQIEKGLAAEVLKGESSRVPLYAEGSFSLLLKKKSNGEIKQETKIFENIKAPVKKGQTLGEISFIRGDETLGTVELKAESEVKKTSFLSALRWLVFGLFTL